MGTLTFDYRPTLTWSHTLSFLCSDTQYLQDTMNHVLSCVKKEKERTAAFQALGLLSVAVRSEFKIYLPRVLDIIRAALPPKDFAHK